MRFNVTADTATIRTVNPATGELLAEYEPFTPAQLDAALADAHAAHTAWGETPFVERTALVHRVADVLRERSDEYARLITVEMGKPLAEAAAEVEKCAMTCD